MTDQKNQNGPREAKGRKAAATKVIEMPKRASLKTTDRLKLIALLANAISRASHSLGNVAAKDLLDAQSRRDQLDLMTKVADATLHASLALSALLVEERGRR